MMGLTKTSGFLALGLSCAVLGTVVVSATAPRATDVQRPDKVEVCHWDETAGTWNKLSIGEPALAAHLRNHDDAVPGGVSSDTGTQLDNDCQAAALLTCPCWNQYTEAQLVTLMNAQPTSSESCQVFDPGATVADGRGLNPGPYALAENGTSTDCLLRLDGGDSGLQVISQEAANACVAELSSVIQQLDWCPVPPK